MTAKNSSNSGDYANAAPSPLENPEGAPGGKKEKVVIIGASPKPERYAYKAMVLLEAKGHEIYLVHPARKEIEGRKVYQSLEDVPVQPDTITLYVNPSALESYVDSIIAKSPGRVIFNPGTESITHREHLEEAGIKTLEACTLVLLTTAQF